MFCFCLFWLPTLGQKNLANEHLSPWGLSMCYKPHWVVSDFVNESYTPSIKNLGLHTNIIFSLMEEPLGIETKHIQHYVWAGNPSECNHSLRLLRAIATVLCQHASEGPGNVSASSRCHRESLESAHLNYSSVMAFFLLTLL